jgi:hypothetical protein
LVVLGGTTEVVPFPFFIESSEIDPLESRLGAATLPLSRRRREKWGTRPSQRYIAEQEKHHQKHSFQEEYLAFLKKNNVTYDERYIWD